MGRIASNGVALNGLVDLTGCFEALQSGRRASLALVSQVLDLKPVSVE